MDQDLKAKWIKALRSGDYQQGQNNLCVISPGDSKRYCCLGVLCEIAGVESTGDTFISYDHNTFYLTNKLLRRFGMTYKEQKILSDLNDGNPIKTRNSKSFDEIADYIEENL